MRSPEIESIAPAVSHQEAMMAVQDALSKCSKSGANDSEYSELLGLQDRLIRRQVSPAEAKKQAEAIFESKQGYH